VGTMIRRILMLLMAVSIAACNSGPTQTADNSVGGAFVVSTTQSPLAQASDSLSLDWGKKAQAAQVSIADILTYGGRGTKITAPTGRQPIRDDSTDTIRQSLYWHTIQANDSNPSTWNVQPAGGDSGRYRSAR
jgi:hypothetical protein